MKVANFGIGETSGVATTFVFVVFVVFVVFDVVCGVFAD